MRTVYVQLDAHGQLINADAYAAFDGFSKFQDDVRFFTGTAPVTSKEDIVVGTGTAIRAAFETLGVALPENIEHPDALKWFGEDPAPATLGDIRKDPYAYNHATISNRQLGVAFAPVRVSILDKKSQLLHLDHLPDTTSVSASVNRNPGVPGIWGYESIVTTLGEVRADKRINYYTWIAPEDQPGLFPLVRLDVDPDYTGLEDLALLPDDTEVWVGRPFWSLAQYRVFVCDGTIVDVRLLGGRPTVALNFEVVDKALDTFECEGAPVAYAMDFGSRAEGITGLLAVSDCFDLEGRGINTQVYARMLRERWDEVCQNPQHRPKSALHREKPVVWVTEMA